MQGPRRSARKRATRRASGVLRRAALQSDRTERCAVRVSKRKRRVIARKGGKAGARARWGKALPNSSKLKRRSSSARCSGRRTRRDRRCGQRRTRRGSSERLRRHTGSRGDSPRIRHLPSPDADGRATRVDPHPAGMSNSQGRTTRRVGMQRNSWRQLLLSVIAVLLVVFGATMESLIEAHFLWCCPAIVGNSCCSDWRTRLPFCIDCEPPNAWGHQSVKGEVQVSFWLPIAPFIAGAFPIRKGG